MEVRPAIRGDLLEIARVAHQSLWESCDGLLRSSTITARLDHDYSPSSLRRRLLAGTLLVAVEPAGSLVGFAESGIEDGHVAIEIHSASAAPRDSRWPAALVSAVRARYPGRPVCADILLGSFAEESRCEAVGFSPGEVIQRTLFGEDVVERRWWWFLAE